MKAAPMTARPNFPLMTQADIVSFYHLQMPRWLFSHPKYKTLSLEAKVAYTFLLNRFQLSRLNGWINADGEVFVIFTRESLAEEMQISYRKAIECFKELAEADLIWEQRLGRGYANQIYLALVQLGASDAQVHTSAPFSGETPRAAKPASLRNTMDGQDLPEPQVKEYDICSSRPADFAGLELQNPHTSKNEKKNIQLREKEVSLSDKLDEISGNCELDLFSPEVDSVFCDAVEKLHEEQCAPFYSVVVESEISTTDGESPSVEAAPPPQESIPVPAPRGISAIPPSPICGTIPPWAGAGNYFQIPFLDVRKQIITEEPHLCHDAGEVVKTGAGTSESFGWLVSAHFLWIFPKTEYATCHFGIIVIEYYQNHSGRVFDDH